MQCRGAPRDPNRAQIASATRDQTLFGRRIASVATIAPTDQSPLPAPPAPEEMPAEPCDPLDCKSAQVSDALQTTAESKSWPSTAAYKLQPRSLPASEVSMPAPQPPD